MREILRNVNKVRCQNFTFSCYASVGVVSLNNIFSCEVLQVDRLTANNRVYTFETAEMACGRVKDFVIVDTISCMNVSDLAKNI